jgi:hypothetical protein
MWSLSLKPADFHGEWNYMISPQPQGQPSQIVVSQRKPANLREGPIYFLSFASKIIPLTA